MRTVLILAAAAAALYAPPLLAQNAATVQVANNAKFGEYLTSANGRPLYVFSTDRPAGAKTATISCKPGKCQDFWPLLTTTGKPQAGNMADASLLGTMNYEGKTVVTYNGWPLYEFVKDAGASAPQGQKLKTFGGEWYLVRPSGKEAKTG